MGFLRRLHLSTHSWPQNVRRGGGTSSPHSRHNPLPLGPRSRRRGSWPAFWSILGVAGGRLCCLLLRRAATGNALCTILPPGTSGCTGDRLAHCRSSGKRHPRTLGTVQRLERLLAMVFLQHSLFLWPHVARVIGIPRSFLPPTEHLYRFWVRVKSTCQIYFAAPIIENRSMVSLSVIGWSPSHIHPLLS